jgi:hypothetical protein
MTDERRITRLGRNSAILMIGVRQNDSHLFLIAVGGQGNSLIMSLSFSGENL